MAVVKNLDFSASKQKDSNMLSKNQFYSWFIRSIDSVLKEKENPKLNEDFRKMVRDKIFRKYLLKSIGPTFKLIETLSPYLLEGMVRPQRLLQNKKNYYVAQDLSTNTYYICYKHLMMLDIDFYKGVTSEDVMEKLEKLAIDSNLLLDIFSSRNGIHAFVVSREFNFLQQKSVEFMLKAGCDFYYMAYSYLRGWSVRLNRKTREESVQMYEFLGRVGNGKPLKHLDELVHLHLELINSEVIPSDEFSTMYAG